MPSVTVHLRLAERVLEHGRALPRRAPFPCDDPASVNAFRLGSFAPDLGYLPGGPRALSDLVHCVRPADLGRALVARARTPVERALAWGWVTHVLADTLVHPLVGCAVGELTHGSPAHFVDGDRDLVSHVRIEAGLDAHYARRHPELRALRPAPICDRSWMSLLSGSLGDVYGVAPAAGVLRRCHRNCARRAAQGLAIAALASLTLPRGGGGPLRAGGERARGPWARLRRAAGGSSVALAYLLPATPPLWLLDAVADVEDAFGGLIMEEVASGGAGLANVNLDTGRPDLGETGHGGLRRALAYLDVLGGVPPRPEWASAGAA
jgi:hypothetical protein